MQYDGVLYGMRVHQYVEKNKEIKNVDRDFLKRNEWNRILIKKTFKKTRSSTLEMLC